MVLLTETGLYNEKITIPLPSHKMDIFLLFCQPAVFIDFMHGLPYAFSVVNPVKKTQTNGMKISICS